MLDNGVTAFADHYFNAGRICDAVIETGIRGDIAPTLFGMTENFDEELDKVTDMIVRRGNESSRLNLRFGPHSPYTCSKDALVKITDRAKGTGAGIHIHLSETRDQVEESIKKHGQTPFEVLYNAGGFEVPVIAAHGLWIREEDLKYLNDETYFAVSPKTYMKMGMGMGNIWSLGTRLKLCSGTDGAASSNTLSPLEQVRMFALIGKMFSKSTDYKLEDIWRILMQGHRALNFNSGFVKEGYAADFAVWDLDRHNTMPVYNPLAAIIYSADSKNIVHTIVDGKFVKRDGKVLLDTDTIIREIYSHSRNILKRGKGNTKIIY
jgi:5-methylthioadenosine/S-adenosylhomocysteine deaminase